ncbi:MAG: hypothetical protein QOH60_2444 [Mycobacterium sp.]|jgi:peptidoglycan hydrolase-like protein with peptidoglycan-binding domain|nr:hypothetical protein [Mycobacterium sp.]
MPATVTPVAGARRRAPVHQVAELQRQVGNRAVAAFLAVQRAAKVGDPDSHAIGVIQQQLNAAGATPRLAITGHFDTQTETATKAFQKKLIGEGVAGITENGIVDGETEKQLNTRAPSVNVSGSDTVVVGAGNTQVPSDPTAGTHADLKAGARGVAVKELQERLNNSGAAIGKKLAVDGVFGPKTDAALKVFQTGAKVTSNGIADVGTWTKLEAAGAATQGHVEFDWLEEVEGVKGVGLRSAFDWKLSKTALTVTAGITFHKKHKNVDGRINQWLADIKEIWSTFAAVNDSDPKKKKMDLNFEAKRGGKDHEVDVFQFDPKLPKKDRATSRSDSGTWYTVDTRRSMAPHEFGHLIGLADEYNRIEEHYINVTGEEPAVGDPTGTVPQATKVASDIKAKLPLDDKLTAPIDKENDKRWGTNLAAVITPALGSKQGGFSRLTAQEYAKANAGASIYTDIQKAFNDVSVPGFQNNLSACVTPFLYSNRSLMGTMETTPAKGSGGKAAPAHEHPIEPRHVQPFVNLLAKEWALQTGKADKWIAERR